MDSTRYCAFNKSRETFLTLDAGILDAALEPLRVLKILIEGLGPGETTGLWLTNFKAIPVARTLSPFDLIYLDQEHRVVHAVELTTDGAFEPFDGEPASAFVLPSSTIASTQTRAGDQLIVVATPQAKPKPLAETPAAVSVPAAPAVPVNSPAFNGIFNRQPDEPPQPRAQVESDSAPLDRFLRAQSPSPILAKHLVQDSPPAIVQPLDVAPPNPASLPELLETASPLVEQPEPAVAGLLREATARIPQLLPPSPPSISPTQPAKSQPDSLASRVRQWLFPLPDPAKPRRARDRRRAYRLPMPDLVAYFWTGGAPRPHRIANISITGFYMFTDDLWMPGTIMRMTLQKMGTLGDKPEDSITVHSRVVRHGSDGGAFEFVLSGFLDRTLPNHRRTRKRSGQ